MLVLREGRIVEQVAIKAISHTQDFKLVLANPVAGLAALLQSIEKLTVLRIEHEQTALLQVPSDHQQQYTLLKALLAKDLPICEFAKVTNNLQDAYLETIRHKS
jgi:ABC-2 type transport system ATP-binding protein